MTPDGNALPMAAVLLAQAMPSDADTSGACVQRAIDAARAAGAHPVVVVLRDGVAAPRDARVVRVKPGAGWISAVRSGMALLANTPARLALVWVPALDAVDADARLATLVVAARRIGASVTAVSEGELSSGPVVVARDAWLDLLTLGEHGMQAVATRRGVHFLEPD